MAVFPATPAEAGTPLLEVDNLSTYFDTVAGTVRSVDGVSYRVEAGRTLGVVGESGCGKSVTALSILRLVPTPPGRYAGGQVRDRKSGGEGKSVSVRVDLGGRRFIKKKKKNNH